MFQEMLAAGSGGGGGYKRAEGSFTTATGTKNITVSELSEIEFVFVYYNPDKTINTAGSKINGTFVNYPWSTVQTDRVTDISGNIFTVNWGSTGDTLNYIAYGK